MNKAHRKHWLRGFRWCLSKVLTPLKGKPPVQSGLIADFIVVGRVLWRRLAVVADQFVPVVMGEKWNNAIPALTILAAMTALRAIVPPVPQVLTVSGEARFTMYNGIMTTVLAPIFFFVGTSWGIVGVAAAWLILQPVTMAPVYWLVFRKLDLSPMVYLGSLWPALLGSASMILAVLGLRMAVPAEWPLAIRLAINVCGGGAVYLATVWSMHGDRLKGFVHLLRSAKD